MEIIMRMINGLLTTTFVLVLVWFIYSLVIRFENNITIFKFRIDNIIAFLIYMSINLFVIYCLIWLVKFFAIRVWKGCKYWENKV